MQSASPSLLGFLRAPERAYRPLETVSLFVRRAGSVEVFDAAGVRYARRDAAAADVVSFAAAGALGTHTARLLDACGSVLDSATFELDAETAMRDDTGRYAELFDVLLRTMRVDSPTGTGSFTWRGRTYPHYVHWILDHSHTAKGMVYFADAAAGLVELLAATQREDGLVWSWVFPREASDHFLSAYGPDGYAREIGDGLVVGRQPVENHCEYNFVDAMHLAWKASGDAAWLARHVGHAIRALNYAPSAPCRWSAKHGLLVRAFTIDSWDFQAEDRYFVPLGIGANQRIDPERTKFGVFFGDNHGYADACDKLAEMLRALGRDAEAAAFEARGAGIRERLDALVWNGSFFRQRVEEDKSVVRDFGVDLDSQMAMSNLYALNRGIRQEQKDAIVAAYRALRDALPPGSPGEWYSVYPPFEKPFSRDCAKWEYMNAGVHAHAAGELVRGAFECGHEDYAVDVLERLRGIALRTKGRILKFAYTGAHEAPPPAPEYTCVDLSRIANMDILVGADGSHGVDWMLSSMPFDMANLPPGERMAGGSPWRVLDRATTGGRVVAAIGRSPLLPDRIAVPLNGATAGAFRLAHCTADHREDPMAALMRICYADGGVEETGLYQGRHVDNWWYVSKAETATGGVFWKGPCAGAVGMGLVWCEVRNPHPGRPIDRLEFERVFDGTVYALVALTLCSAPVWEPKPFESYGGPDNWSGGLVMAGLQEGLVGVRQESGSAAFERLCVSPRWAETDVSEVECTTRLAASNGYVAYRLTLDRAARRISGEITTGAKTLALRLLLPRDAGAEVAFSVNGAPAACRIVGRYLEAEIPTTAMFQAEY